VNRKISLSSGSTQEAYLWRESHRTIYNSLLAIGENETVLQIQLLRTFNIAVIDPNTIDVKITGYDTEQTIEAKYTRVDDDIKRKLLDRPDAQVALSSLSLSGRYIGKLGLVVDFQGPHVTWRDAAGTRTGSYVMFSLGSALILSARFGATADDPGRIRSWLVGYEERKDNVSYTRTLTLTPVQLTVNGYEESNGDPVSLLQYQDLRSQ